MLQFLRPFQLQAIFNRAHDHQFCLAKVRKTAQKALGKARNHRSLAEGKSKSGAEGESLNPG